MDDVAADFATQLYAELAIRPLKAAFEAASAAVRIRRGQDPRELVQEDLVVEEEWAATWPWVLACSPELEEWRLV
jgi:hypothetical protein